MAKVLYLKASPRGERSQSIAVADAFIAAYRQHHPKEEILTIDLFHKELPPFDGPALEAKYAILHGQKPSAQDVAAWRRVEEIIAEFTSADTYVFAIPMWNFGIPYRLKHYLDIIIQPTYTFSFSPKEGYQGLVTGKPAMVVYARGGAYLPGSGGEGFDRQKSYVELALGFIGFTDIRSLVVEPTLAEGPEVAKTKEAAAVAEARRLAAAF